MARVIGRKPNAKDATVIGKAVTWWNGKKGTNYEFVSIEGRVHSGALIRRRRRCRIKVRDGDEEKYFVVRCIKGIGGRIRRARMRPVKGPADEGDEGSDSEGEGED